MALDFRDCNNTALRLAARRLGGLFDEALAPVGLKATQASMLSEIARLTVDHGGIAPTLQELALTLAVQISAVTHALPPLTRDGLVELQPDQSDRRTKRASLTSQGKRKLAKATQLWAAANQRVEAALGPTNAAALRVLAGQVMSDGFLDCHLGPEAGSDSK